MDKRKSNMFSSFFAGIDYEPQYVAQWAELGSSVPDKPGEWVHRLTKAVNHDNDPKYNTLNFKVLLFERFVESLALVQVTRGARRHRRDAPQRAAPPRAAHRRNTHRRTTSIAALPGTSLTLLHHPAVPGQYALGGLQRASLQAPRAPKARCMAHRSPQVVRCTARGKSRECTVRCFQGNALRCNESSTKVPAAAAAARIATRLPCNLRS